MATQSATSPKGTATTIAVTPASQTVQARSGGRTTRNSKRRPVASTPECHIHETASAYVLDSRCSTTRSSIVASRKPLRTIVLANRKSSPSRESGAKGTRASASRLKSTLLPVISAEPGRRRSVGSQIRQMTAQSPSGSAMPDAASLRDSSCAHRSSQSSGTTMSASTNPIKGACVASWPRRRDAPRPRLTSFRINRTFEWTSGNCSTTCAVESRDPSSTTITSNESEVAWLSSALRHASMRRSSLNAMTMMATCGVIGCSLAPKSDSVVRHYRPLNNGSSANRSRRTKAQ